MNYYPIAVPEFGPPSEERREMMRRFLTDATDPQELRTRALLYVLDPAYNRGDIVVVLAEVERMKGWKA